MPKFILLLHERPDVFPPDISPDQIQAATLTRRLGSRHLQVAEDAVQEALMTALQQWPLRGVPDQPDAWLFQVATNRALDRLRHARMAADKAPAVLFETATATEPAATQALLRDELPPLEDDQLGLIFLVCQPSLPPDARVALALKLAGGFSVGEIARAFLVQESAIAQRLVRARSTPEHTWLASRLANKECVQCVLFPPSRLKAASARPRGSSRAKPASGGGPIVRTVHSLTGTLCTRAPYAP